MHAAQCAVFYRSAANETFICKFNDVMVQASALRSLMGFVHLSRYAKPLSKYVHVSEIVDRHA